MKNKQNIIRLFLTVLSVVLVAAMSLNLSACSKETPQNEKVTPADVATTQARPADGAEIGEGANSFTFTVTLEDGSKTVFFVKTDETVVGKALLSLGLIEGENGDYGLYVKSVDGTRADYEKDGAYWAFYENGEMAMSGVDTTEITEGGNYGFVYTKA